MNNKNRPGLASWALLGVLLPGVLMVQGCNSTLPESNRNTVAVSPHAPLIDAAAEGDLETVKDLVDEGLPVNARAPEATPLTQAAAGGHDQVVWYLLRQGADPDLAPPGALPPLMLAARLGHDRVVEMLIRAGADINAATADGDTALAGAARSGNLSIVKTLLDEGANVNVTSQGESLLMQVVASNNLLMSQVLIDAGADVNYISPQGRTALDVARKVGNRDLEMLLVQSGARG